MDLFSQNLPHQKDTALDAPLAERARPRTLDDFVGHEAIVGQGSALRASLSQNRLKSLILWGQPGVGKTTLARVIANTVKSEFVSMSAVTAGVAEVRKTIAKARDNRKYLGKPTILFIDEIHRFNKAQQDALLHVVEDGTITLIGATTENPSFEVIAPLLSRCQVYKMAPLTNDHICRIVTHAIETDPLMAEKQVDIDDWDALYILADGDARRALNSIERAVDLLGEAKPPLRLTQAVFEKAAQQKVLNYDKSGDYHYDLISAFIKSLRGSDPDAAIYWMARMLAAGEDPKFVARRMLILASEDVGNADPQAFSIATSCFTAVTYIGMPECQIILSQTAAYLAAAPKSNAAYLAIKQAMDDVRQQPEVRVPMHLRNAPTGLMKRLDYGKDYQYAHDYPEHFIKMNYLPPEVADRVYYAPTEMGAEKTIRARLARLWQGIKNYPDKTQSRKEADNDQSEK